METRFDPLFIACVIFIIVVKNAHAESNHHHINNPLLLNCGSEHWGTDSDGRKWDTDTQFLPAAAAKSSVVTKPAAHESERHLPDVPYISARIFTTETAYQFPNPEKTDRVVFRVHFYPGVYPGFNISDSRFTLLAGGYTLLKNFSVYETAVAQSVSHVTREFFLVVDGPNFNVTFLPDPTSYAFVNVIEIISPPAEIFEQEAPLAGLGGDDDSTNLGITVTSTVSLSVYSLQTMFRVNVGGPWVPPVSDSSGLMRSWIADGPYIFNPRKGVAMEANVAAAYKTMAPPEVALALAPPEVYRTWRSLGPDPNENKKSNLTWVFHVDPSFSYLVRLHWSEWEFDKVNQRVFSVLINNQTAEAEADVISWTESKAAPMTKDYVAYFEEGNDKLWVTLKPVVSTAAQYFDVLLNGLEIFKLSDDKFNLAGPNPTSADLMRGNLRRLRIRGYSGAVVQL